MIISNLPSTKDLNRRHKEHPSTPVMGVLGIYDAYISLSGIISTK
nr:MAG TPA: hypothetical protein [Caudoviricetes sp.]